MMQKALCCVNQYIQNSFDKHVVLEFEKYASHFSYLRKRIAIVVIYLGKTVSIPIMNFFVMGFEMKKSNELNCKRSSV